MEPNVLIIFPLQCELLFLKSFLIYIFFSVKITKNTNFVAVLEFWFVFLWSLFFLVRKEAGLELAVALRS